MSRGSVFRLFTVGSNIRRLLVLLVCVGLLYLALVNFSFSNKPVTYEIRDSDNAIEEPKGIAEHNEKAMDRLLVTISVDELNFPNVSTAEESASDLLAGDVLKMDAQLGAGKDSTLPLCPKLEDITNYEKHMYQATLLIEDLSEEEVQAAHPDVVNGGRWTPSDCRARHKVAIIIPYRDRKSHLIRLLDFLIPLLQKQLLDFRFIVTEQYGDDLFNKGRIMNAAFRLAHKLNVDCVIFHDVDMFPQDDRTPYDCPPTPRHIGAFVSNLGYQLWYKEIVGGALAIGVYDYLHVNGYSNQYWAWGGEDDDFGKRIYSLNYTIERPDSSYARYSMLKHVKRKRTAPSLIYKLLGSASTRWVTDGVNQTGQWNVLQVIVKPLYYHMIVDVGIPPKEWRSGA
jgi:beta-1,4-galactosyltransferase 1